MAIIRLPKLGGNAAIKLIIISFIVASTLFLMTMEVENDQIAPAMGLFGTVAGYILGKQNDTPKPQNNEEGREEPS